MFCSTLELSPTPIACAIRQTPGYGSTASSCSLGWIGLFFSLLWLASLLASTVLPFYPHYPHATEKSSCAHYRLRPRNRPGYRSSVRQRRRSGVSYRAHREGACRGRKGNIGRRRPPGIRNRGFDAGGCVRACSRYNSRKIRQDRQDRKSTRLNSSHITISYAVFC